MTGLLFVCTLECLGEIHKILQIHNLVCLNHEEIENLKIIILDGDWIHNQICSKPENHSTRWCCYWILPNVSRGMNDSHSQTLPTNFKLTLGDEQASISLIAKPDKNTDWIIKLIKADAKLLNKVLANWIQYHIEVIISDRHDGSF
jgi:hypothetical protein